jgi:hypothetical protein
MPRHWAYDDHLCGLEWVCHVEGRCDVEYETCIWYEYVKQLKGLQRKYLYKLALPRHAMKAHNWQHEAWQVTTRQVKQPPSPTAALKEDRCKGLDGLAARIRPSWLRTLGQREYHCWQRTFQSAIHQLLIASGGQAKILQKYTFHNKIFCKWTVLKKRVQSTVTKRKNLQNVGL